MVGVGRTQAEIRLVLAHHRADGVALASNKDGDAIQFVIHGKHYQFKVARPRIEDVRRYFPTGSRLSADYKIEREWKRLWRARLLWLRATLEFASSEGDGEVMRSLAAYLLMPDGRTTVGDALEAGGVALLGDGK